MKKDERNPNEKSDRPSCEKITFQCNPLRDDASMTKTQRERGREREREKMRLVQAENLC